MCIAFCIDFTMVDQESLISWSFSLVQVHDWTQKLNTSELVEVDIWMFWWHKSVKVCFKLHPPGKQACRQAGRSRAAYHNQSIMMDPQQRIRKQALYHGKIVKTFSQCSSHWKVPSQNQRVIPSLRQGVKRLLNAFGEEGKRYGMVFIFITAFDNISIGEGVYILKGI